MTPRNTIMRQTEPGFWSSCKQPSIVLTIAALLFAGAMSWAALKAHPADQTIHHTWEAMDGRYQDKALSEERWAEERKRLDRIESKLDAIAAQLQEHRATGK